MLDFPFMWALLIKTNWIKFGLIKRLLGFLIIHMGLASVWAEYGPARNERARGQNSIYIEGSSPSQTLRIRITILTYSFLRNIF